MYSMIKRTKKIMQQKKIYQLANHLRIEMPLPNNDITLTTERPKTKLHKRKMNPLLKPKRKPKQIIKCSKITIIKKPKPKNQIKTLS